ncbi:MAG: 3-deoxy-7-phosphoheptulonate synthase [Eubacterium sp.]|nr:3-deoxy-7-phosphoheptulonate synthase [Eubacterium sp.]
MEMEMDFIRKLPTPQEIKEQFPVDAEITRVKEERDEEIAKIFSDNEDKFILIIGPCSADNEDSVCEYMSRLAEVSEHVKDRLFIIPRCYTGKPRTVGVGYKGMVHQPDPDKPEDMLAGLIAIRGMHTRIAKETGFTCAEEMLYPENHRYLSDLLAYVAIGARSVEDQHHRQVASGIGVPAGMKNPTEGDLSVMMNSILAAQHEHTFIYRGWEVKSKGNSFAHAILRGYVDQYGLAHPNYHYEDLEHLLQLYSEKDYKNPCAIIDTNHSNSGKKYEEQIRIAKDVMHSRHEDPEIRKLVKGLMIESYLVDGCQPAGGGTYGQSITDPCLGWEKTEKLIYDLAELV